MNVIFIIILSLFDSFLFGYCYEYHIKHPPSPPSKGEYTIGIFKPLLFNSIFKFIEKPVRWLFWEMPMFGEKWVPRYRLLVQWPLDGLALLWLWNGGHILPLTPSEGGIYLLGYNFGTWQFWGMLAAIYAMSKEFDFYVWLGQWDGIKNLNENPYWLKRIYFAGAWLFNPYTYKKFVWSAGITGHAICILSNFI